MDIDSIEFGEADSPFFLFPISPISFVHETLETEIPSSSIIKDGPYKDTCHITNSHYINSLDIWGDLNDNFNVSSPSISSTTDDYNIISLDEVSSSSDILETSLDPNPVSQTQLDLRVTSPLKSALISGQKSKQEEHVRPFSSVELIHSYSSKDNKGNQDDSFTQDNRYTHDNRTTNSTLRFPPCYVCGGNASGLHYGVNSCEPCKGFFTRYLRKGEDYICAKKAKCEITNRLRGNCSACRLQRCLALGMSRKNSRLGRYTLARRMETIMQMKKLEGKYSDGEYDTRHKFEIVVSSDDITVATEEVVAETRFNHPPSKNMEGFSLRLVKYLVEHMENIRPYGKDLRTTKQIHAKLDAYYEAFILRNKLLGNMEKTQKEEYYTLGREFGIEIDHRLIYLKHSAKEVVDVSSRYCNFGKQIPNFTSLSNKDQSNLLKTSRFDFFVILMHESYHHEKQVFLAHNGMAFHKDEVADKVFSRKLILNICDMYHRLQMLKLSKEEKALLVAISLVFTDRCVLENPNLVEQIQISLAQLLRQQLKKVYKTSASKRFTKIIDFLTVMRESSELYLSEYNQLCNGERMTEDVSQMNEMVVDS